MKKWSSIFLLILFCVYSFTFKTHYCFHLDSGERFHGDCEWQMKEAASKGELGHANIFPAYYYCHDLVKTAQPQEVKATTVKIAFHDLFILTESTFSFIPQSTIIDWLIPEECCRSAPTISHSFLRGPPLV